MTPPSPHVAAIVLAAGLGTRMRSRRPKILHDLCGRPMLAYVLEAAREATGSTPLVVYSPHTAALCEAFAGQAEFALQDEPRGTGDAVRAALAALPADVTEVAVLSGDTPLLQASTVTAALEARRAADAAMAITTVRLDDPTGYGRVVRDGRQVARIVEEKDASDDERAIDEVNAGLYAFDAAWLSQAIGDLAPSSATGELYLTSLVEMALRDGGGVAAHEHDDELELGGINDRVQLAAAEAELRWQVLERHMLAGVTMIDPLGVYVDATVQLSEDVTLEAGVVLRGATRVGRDSLIRSGSQLVDSVVGEGCTIWASVLESATVEDGAVIGPFAHLRPGAHVGARAEIGNFAEIKKARLGAGTKQHHFSYIGDADIGADVNIGAGTITANYDGQAKHRTVIGDGAFIGSDTIIRAPVTIGAGAYTGAGSVVTRDVPPGKLAVGVPARIRDRKRDARSKPDPAADPTPPDEGAA